MFIDHFNIVVVNGYSFICAFIRLSQKEIVKAFGRQSVGSHMIWFSVSIDLRVQKLMSLEVFCQKLTGEQLLHRDVAAEAET